VFVQILVLLVKIKEKIVAFFNPIIYLCKKMSIFFIYNLDLILRFVINNIFGSGYIFSPISLDLVFVRFCADRGSLGEGDSNTSRNYSTSVSNNQDSSTSGSNNQDSSTSGSNNQNSSTSGSNDQVVDILNLNSSKNIIKDKLGSCNDKEELEKICKELQEQIDDNFDARMKENMAEIAERFKNVNSRLEYEINRALVVETSDNLSHSKIYLDDVLFSERKAIEESDRFMSPLDYVLDKQSTEMSDIIDSDGGE
jgi:hypothetical protein